MKRFHRIALSLGVLACSCIEGTTPDPVCACIGTPPLLIYYLWDVGAPYVLECPFGNVEDVIDGDRVLGGTEDRARLCWSRYSECRGYYEWCAPPPGWLMCHEPLDGHCQYHWSEVHHFYTDDGKFEVYLCCNPGFWRIEP